MSAAQKTAQNLRVGISLYIRKGEQTLWENGIFQNCLFLAMLLERAPSVKEVYLVMDGEGDKADAKRFIGQSPVPMIDMATAANRLDLIIEMSVHLNHDWAVRFKERGGKVLAMRVGNDYVIDIERMMFDKPAGLVLTDNPYDEVWTLPEYARTCVHYYQSAMRAPVHMMPHLWSPLFLERAAPGLSYQPGSQQWRVGVFEPNLCMVKTSHLAMLLIDLAHRAQPELLRMVRFYNTFHIKQHATFMAFANSLDIVRHGVASFEGRFPLYQVLGGDSTNLVVSHHWENGQNYLYYEVLHGGFPLVHNSTFLADCGYYYPGFDCEEGSLALRQACAQHDADLPTYKQKAQAFLRTLAPDYEDNVRAYNDALARVYAAT